MELISWLEGGLFSLLFFMLYDLGNRHNDRLREIQKLEQKVSDLELELERETKDQLRSHQTQIDGLHKRREMMLGYSQELDRRIEVLEKRAE
jgi:hypothetical protein